MSLKGINSSSLRYLCPYVLGLSVQPASCKGRAGPEGWHGLPGCPDSMRRLGAGLGWAAVPAPVLSEGLLRAQDLYKSR